MKWKWNYYLFNSLHLTFDKSCFKGELKHLSNVKINNREKWNSAVKCQTFYIEFGWSNFQIVLFPSFGFGKSGDIKNAIFLNFFEMKMKLLFRQILLQGRVKTFVKYPNSIIERNEILLPNVNCQT